MIYCYIGCEDEVTTWYYSTQLIDMVNTYDVSVVSHIQRIGCQTLKMFISHELIRHESSRGHKIDGTKPNKPAIRSEISRQSRQKRTDKKVQRTLSR